MGGNGVVFINFSGCGFSDVLYIFVFLRMLRNRAVDSEFKNNFREDDFGGFFKLRNNFVIDLIV